MELWETSLGSVQSSEELLAEAKDLGDFRTAKISSFCKRWRRVCSWNWPKSPKSQTVY
jgi:hypothetical protein